jgi:UDP-glucose 4-epimerase
MAKKYYWSGQYYENVIGCRISVLILSSQFNKFSNKGLIYRIGGVRMKVLVTGGLGFIGSHIVDGLIGEGYDVVVVDNMVSGIRKNLHSQATFYEMDIRDQEIETVFRTEKPDCVIHQAAQVSVQHSMENPLYDCSQNIIATINLLNACKKFGVKKFIFASTAAIYGVPEDFPIKEDHKLRPLSFYGLSKATCEEYIRRYCKLYDIDYTILRYANVYGPRQSKDGEAGVITIFINQLMNKNPINVYGDGKQTRDFIYVKDVARANILALTRAHNKTINISSNKETSLNHLIQELTVHFGGNKDIIINYLDKRPGDISRSCLSNVRAKTDLTWEPTPEWDLSGGIAETIKYFNLNN